MHPYKRVKNNQLYIQCGAARNDAVHVTLEPVINLLARGRYLIDKVRQVPELDFDNLFLSATGITVDLYMEILFMVMTQWSIKSDENKLDDIAIRSIKQFFKFTDLTEEQIEKFMNLVSFEEGDYTVLRNTMLERTGMKSDDPGNFIVFVDRPIMRFGEFFICINNHFLALKLVSGPYRIIEQALKSTRHPNLLVDAWGDVYEQYINERMSSAFGAHYLADIKDKSGQQVIDGLLDRPHEAFPVEVKYPHWTFKARITGGRDEMRKYVHKFMRYKPYKEKPGAPVRRDKKGVGQIKQFAEKLTKNDIESRVTVGNKVLTPILVLGEEFPPDPMNRKWLEGIAASEGCIIKNAKPFILLSSEEVELLESFAEQLGVDETVRLISEYAQQFKTGKTIYDLPSSFKNMAISAGVKTNNNKFLHKQLRAFEIDVKKHLKKPDTSK